MQNKLSVYVVGNQKNYASWLPDYNLCKTIKDSDIVLFTGGEDVSPKLYNEKVGSKTCFNYSRDLQEVECFNIAKKENKPMLGICRGSQFLCVMAGGRLVQDQQNLHAVHPIITYDGNILNITSTHHQAQYPYDMSEKNYKLIGWTENLSSRHLDGNDKEISKKSFKEAEIVYYPEIKALGIQGHPEYNEMMYYPETITYLRVLVNNLINNSFNF